MYDNICVCINMENELKVLKIRVKRKIYYSDQQRYHVPQCLLSTFRNGLAEYFITLDFFGRSEKSYFL